MREAAFVLGNLLVLSIAFACAELCFRNRESWRRVLAAVAGYPVIILFVVLILGTLEQLSAWMAVGLLAVIAGALYSVRWRIGSSVTSDVSPPYAVQQTEGADGLMWSVSVGLLGAIAGMFATRAILVGTNFKWDDLSYHAPAVAGWLIDGRLSLVPFNYHAYFPLNAETLSMWFMLPFRSDALASLSGLYWATLMVVAAIALSLAQRHAGWVGVLIGALILTSPVVMGTVHSFAPVDLAGAALVLAAIAFAIPSSGQAMLGPRVIDAAYAGLLSGFAMGCKVSFAPVTGILLLWYAFGQRHLWSKSGRARIAATFLVCAAASGSYWFVRNVIITQNPIFPAELGPLAGPFDSLAQYRTKLISWILAAPADIGQWRHIVTSAIQWPFGLFLLATVGYGAALYSQLRRRAADCIQQSATRFLLLTIGITLVVMHPLMPFSGTINSAEAGVRITLRYLIAPFAIGVILFSTLIDRRRPWRLFWSSLALLVAVTAWSHSARLSVIAVLAGGVTVWLWQQCQDSLSRKHIERSVRWVLIPVGLITLALWMPSYR